MKDRRNTRRPCLLYLKGALNAEYVAAPLCMTTLREGFIGETRVLLQRLHGMGHKPVHGTGAGVRFTARGRMSGKIFLPDQFEKAHVARHV